MLTIVDKNQRQHYGDKTNLHFADLVLQELTYFWKKTITWINLSKITSFECYLLLKWVMYLSNVTIINKHAHHADTVCHRTTKMDPIFCCRILLGSRGAKKVKEKPKVTF